MAPAMSLPECLVPVVERSRAHMSLKGLGVDVSELRKMDMRGRFRVACAAWARHGLGSPPVVQVYYLLKAFLYLVGFWAFQRRHSGSWGLGQLLGDFKFRRDAFSRFVLYNLLFEVLGLGCGSGLLTGRLLPPHTAWYHFLCPGTMKLPLRANPRDDRRPLLPWLGTTRTRGDVLLFAGYLAALLRALTSRRVTPARVRPVVALLGILAVVDHTIFLASRGEVYGSMAVAHAAGAPVIGQQLVQLAIYAWAAFSKFGPWFHNVHQVMMSNSPIFPRRLLHLMYRDIDGHDYRASQFAKMLTFGGTALEAAIPALLPCGGRLSQLGLLLSLQLHGFIFSSFAVGVPQEWNIFTPLAAGHLFLDAADGLDVAALRRLPADHPLLSAFLAFMLVGVQTMGSLRPQTNSFLTSMKYYAGNWPTTIWLVRRDAWHKLDRLKTLSEPFPEQAARMFGDDMREVSPLLVYAWRAMHLPYRGLAALIERALQGRSFDDYRLNDGEAMAGFALGYNFGDGYLHGRFMLQAVQDICGFEPGELLHISIDSCPAFGDRVPWWIRDATSLWDDDAAIATGSTTLRDLEDMQPY